MKLLYIGNISIDTVDDLKNLLNGLKGIKGDELRVNVVDSFVDGHIEGFLHDTGKDGLVARLKSIDKNGDDSAILRELVEIVCNETYQVDIDPFQYIEVLRTAIINNKALFEIKVAKKAVESITIKIDIPQIGLSQSKTIRLSQYNIGEIVPLEINIPDQEKEYEIFFYINSNSIKTLNTFGMSDEYSISVFEDAGEFHEGFAKVRINENESGYVDTDGHLVIRLHCGFYDIEDFSEGLAAVKNDGRWGYIDTSGRVVIEYKFVEAGPFKLGLAPVRVPNTRVPDLYSSPELAHQWGYINKNGDVIIPPIYDLAGPFNVKQSLALVGKMQSTSSLCGFIDSSGQVVIPLVHQRLSYISDDGLASFEVNQKGNYSFINNNGARAFSSVFNLTGSFSEGYCAVRNDSYKWGFIDTYGKVIIDFRFDYAESFSDGIARVSLGKKEAFVNIQGSFVSDNLYDNARNFSEGVASVKVGHKWGIIDSSGNFTVYPTYDCVFGCKDGLIPVMKKVNNKEEWFYIHKDGTKL